MAYMPRGRAGMLAVSSPRNRIVSGISEVDAPLPVGIAVAFGSVEGGFQLPAANVPIFGITIHDNTAYPSSISVAPRSRAAILRQGVVWVVTETDVTPGAPACVRHTAGEISPIGSLGGGGSGTTEVEGMRWLEPAAAGTLTKLDVNLS